jgi:hypothetical protein
MAPKFSPPVPPSAKTMFAFSVLCKAHVKESIDAVHRNATNTQGSNGNTRENSNRRLRAICSKPVVLIVFQLPVPIRLSSPACARPMPSQGSAQVTWHVHPLGCHVASAGPPNKNLKHLSSRRNPQPTMSLIEERELRITPIVPENVMHNTKVLLALILHLYRTIAKQESEQTLTDIRSLTSSILGVAAGILGLESQTGFAFYIGGSILVSVLMLFLLARGAPKSYFRSQADIWTHEVFGTTSLSSFVLTWTLFYNLVRA